MKRLLVGLLCLAIATPALAGKGGGPTASTCEEMKEELDARLARNSPNETRIVAAGEAGSYKVVATCEVGLKKIILAPKPAQSPAQPPALKPGTYTGHVKSWDSGIGSGFITPDNGAADVFVHFTAIQMEGYKGLNENQWVRFDVVVGPKGPQAANVRTTP